MTKSKELSDRQIVIYELPKSYRKSELKAVIKKLENLIALTAKDISKVHRFPSGTIRVTFKDKQIVDDIMKKNYRKNSLPDGTFNYSLIDKSIRACLTREAHHNVQKANQELNKKNALVKLNEEEDHFYVLEGDPGFRNGVSVRLVKKESKELCDRQIIIHDLPNLHMESHRESESKAVIKKLEDLVTITEEDISFLNRMSSGAICVTFKDKQIVEDILKKNQQKNVLPDGTFHYSLVDKNIKACLTRQAKLNVQKANEERDKKNDLLKEEDDHFYVLDGDPGFRNSVSVRLVKKVGNTCDDTLSDKTA